ncbi:hypothetical protein EJ04DRAFT_541422 [Polyplosphaeria fusca]|uniref:Translation machinery-associated protein 16 n=1 Tax=Polyplosphaeria fusca TaxID=682080 RepID=A0A9P4R774_9PLEO|nr:hypothetical protein EJ04DRAFT_541422 [Polyplosphaeria fusca]
MPSNRLGKVQKHITKKKGKNVVLHENSRDTRRLQSASARDDKLNRLAALREKQNKPYLLRIKYFQTCAQEHESTFSTEESHAMIEGYLQRENEELAALKADRRAGRPPSTRETLLKQNQESEKGEFASGFWIPDLEDEHNVGKLKDWSGQWSNLSTMNFVRITKDGAKHPSAFPPKGLS